MIQLGSDVYNRIPEDMYDCADRLNAFVKDAIAACDELLFAFRVAEAAEDFAGDDYELVFGAINQWVEALVIVLDGAQDISVALKDNADAIEYARAVLKASLT